MKGDRPVRLSERALQPIVDELPDLVCYFDREQRYRFINKKYTEWFGPRSDIINRTIREVIGDEPYRQVEHYINAALGGEKLSFDSQMPYEGPGTRYIRVTYVPDVRPGVGTVGVFALINDLTEMKRSAELLRFNEEKLRVMMESLVDVAIVAIDAGGIVTSWNKGAENLFGYTEAEMIGCGWDMLFTAEDLAREMPQREMRAALRQGRSADQRWYVRRDGTRFFAGGMMTPLYIGDRLSGYAKTAADLTEKKRFAEMQQQAHDELEIRVQQRIRELADMNVRLINEMNDRAAAERRQQGLLQKIVTIQEDERRRIARDLHDQLGQLLTGLRLKIESLSETVSREPQDDIPERVQRLKEIAGRLDSEVSFLAWQLRPPALEELGLREALAAYIRESSLHFDRRIDFHVTGLGGIELNPEVETQLYRITQEALNNVIKHADAKHVTVLLKRRGGELILIIEDDGCGFVPEEAEGARHDPEQGIGLTGMRERATMMGAAFEIETEPGSGTAIYVRVPLSAKGQ